MPKSYVDLLDEDKPIAQQKFVCVSFVSPESILKSKQLYFFEQFVRTWDLCKSMDKYAQFTMFLSYKYNLNQELVNTDLHDFCKEEAEKLNDGTIYEAFKTFLDKNEDTLQQKFDADHTFQTNVRGLKIRGVFPSQAEAEMRAKSLRECDPNFDVYVGPVGVWMPWEPEAYKTGRVEYLEEELNSLMANKKTNEESAKDYFDKRVKETKQKAIEENKLKAQESGNKLTQSISESGELVGIANTNTHHDFLNQSDATPDTVRRTLFGPRITVFTKDGKSYTREGTGREFIFDFEGLFLNG